MGWEVFPLAIRRILNGSHAILRSHARPVRKINDVIISLLDDMAETMYENNGVGSARRRSALPSGSLWSIRKKSG